jgi:hypothetical protein
MYSPRVPVDHRDVTFFAVSFEKVEYRCIDAEAGGPLPVSWLMNYHSAGSMEQFAIVATSLCHIPGILAYIPVD